ncbi:DUF2589 domain-containing protein [Nostoc sp. CHAB 5844]|nr:DUF2589 domain-containing protein [Nostoc sp. CHAB 5844]
MNTLEPDKMVDFGQLIAQPIIATIDAEASAAERFVQFLEEYGLEDGNQQDASQSKRQMKMLIFTYSQTDLNGKEHNFTVKVPLLSLIPLPLLHIDTAEFDFDIRLFTQVEYQDKPGGQKGSLIPNRGESEDKDKFKKKEVGEFKGFQARLSPTTGRSDYGKSTQSLDANMKVKIKMKQSDLPNGLMKLMTVFESSTSIKAEENPPKLTEQPPMNPAQNEAATA